MAMNESNREKVALYARVSTADKGQEVENQLTELRRFAASQGWTVYAEYIDHETGKHLLVALIEEEGSRSLVVKVRTYVKAALEFAVRERLIDRNPGRGLRLPSLRKLPPECRDFLPLEQVRNLLEEAHGRERLILRMFIVLGLRP